MKIQYLLSLTILSLLLYSACNRCPKDESLGQLNLRPESQTWMPYQGGEQLTFQNQDGETLTFDLPNQLNEREDLVVDVPCSQGSFLTPTEQTIFYEAEGYRLFLVSERGQEFSFILNLRPYQVDDLPGTDTLLIDYLEATAQFGSSVANLFRPTSNRSNPEVTNDQLEGLNNSRLIGDTTLMGRPFTNVYTNQRTSGSATYVYYSTDLGFVGVDTPEGGWVLVP